MLIDRYKQRLCGSILRLPNRFPSNLNKNFKISPNRGGVLRKNLRNLRKNSTKFQHATEILGI